jgi:hypothetical protein
MSLILPLISSLLIAWGTAVLCLLPFRNSWRRVRVPLAFGFGFAAGYLRLMEQWWLPFPPTDSTQWLFFLMLPLMLWGLIQSRGFVPFWGASLLRLVLCGGGWLLLLAPLQASERLWLPIALGCAGISALIWSVLERPHAQTGWTAGLTGVMVSGTSALLLMLGHSVVLTQQALILTGLQALLLLPGLRTPTSPSESRLIVIPGLALLWGAGRFFADLSPWVLLLIPALLAPELAGLKMFARRSAIMRQGLLLGASLLCCALAAAATWLSQPAVTPGSYY